MTTTFLPKQTPLAAFMAHLRFLAAEVDTRSAEIVVSIITFVFTIWLSFAPIGAQPKLEEALDHIGGRLPWIVPGLFVAAYLGVSLFWRYPRHRTFAGSLFSLYWGLLTYCLASINPQIFFVWLALTQATVGLWIVMHRFAVRKPAPLSS